MDAPRVCFVVNAVGETSVPADIARALREYTDARVDVLAWFDAEPFDGSDAMDVVCLDAPDTALGVDRKAARRTRSVFGRYDLVQAHHNHSGSIAKVLARLDGIPTVSREGNLRRGFTRKGRVANGLTNGLAERVVPNSTAVLRSFRRWERVLLPDDRIRVIPNGVDPDRLAAGRALDWDVRHDLGVPPDAVLVANAAHLTEQKAHEVLVRALAVANRQPDRRLHLAIAGDGPREASLRSLARDEGVTDDVHFLGQIDRLRVYRLLATADVYAMPSRWEGFSAAAVEALGVGVACVFSDIEPFREPFEDVALFHAVDDAVALADRLTELADSAQLRRDYASRGRKLVREQYTMKAVAGAYRDLYAEILDER